MRILTSDLSTVQTLVGSLEVENSRLVQENERLSREDISVQQESAGLTTDRLTREREDVDMFGGQGTYAQQRMTTRRLDPGNPWVREQTTGLTWSQPEHVLQCLEAGRETETNSCSRRQAVTRGDYPHPTLGTLPQERLNGGRGSRQMVEEGVREGQTRTENEEGHYHRGGRQMTTPMDFQTVTNAVTVRSTRATGLDTLMTFSANCPQTVTFDRPISQRTASGPPRNMTTTVSMGRKGN